jgi:hypothetical protein
VCNPFVDDDVIIWYKFFFRTYSDRYFLFDNIMFILCERVSPISVHIIFVLCVNVYHIRTYSIVCTCLRSFLNRHALPALGLNKDTFASCGWTRLCA